MPMYSASVLERTTTDCLFEDQEIAALLSMKTYPQIEWRSSNVISDRVAIAAYMGDPIASW